METVTISKHEYLQMKQNIKLLRETELYRRLLQFEENVKTGKIYIRKDLGF